MDTCCARRNIRGFHFARFVVNYIVSQDHRCEQSDSHFFLFFFCLPSGFSLFNRPFFLLEYNIIYTNTDFSFTRENRVVIFSRRFFCKRLTITFSFLITVDILQLENINTHQKLKDTMVDGTCVIYS